MKKSNKSTHTVRIGEGAQITAYPASIVGTDGHTAVQISIDLGSAPVPDRRYAADFSGLIFRDGIVKFIFGQDKIGHDEVRSLLIILMHQQDVHYMIQGLNGVNTQENVLSITEVAKSADIKESELRQISTEPDQTIALYATHALFAMSGNAACIDFYNSSPFAMAELEKTQSLAVDPVVRVDLPTSYLLAINTKIKELLSGGIS